MADERTQFGRPLCLKFERQPSQNSYVHMTDAIEKKEAKHITGTIFDKTAPTVRKLNLADITDIKVGLNISELNNYVLGPFVGNTLLIKNIGATVSDFYVRDVQSFLARKGSRTPVNQPVKFGECRVGCSKTISIGGVVHQCLNFKMQNLAKTVSSSNYWGMTARPDIQQYIGPRWFAVSDYQALLGSKNHQASPYCIQRLCGDGGSEFGSYYVASIKAGQNATLKWDFPAQTAFYLAYERYDTRAKHAKEYTNKGSHTITGLKKDASGYLYLLDASKAVTSFFRFKVIAK